jgi:hypothetical protein
MKRLVAAALAAAALIAAGGAEAAPTGGAAATGTLRIVVKDPSGAVIPNATVRVTGEGQQPIVVSSDAQGVATAVGLPVGRYTVVVDFPGFAARTLTDVRVRPGDNRREAMLAIEKVAESVSVGRDAATAASDPRSNRFGNVLSKDQIDALPDDPDEMEAALKEMAGPGAVLRVDGFRGGKLPPKSQIRSIRFSQAMFAAENHSAGHTFIDIATQPGLGPLRGGMDVSFRDDALNARNAFQPEKTPEETQQYNLNLSGTLLKDRTSFSFAGGGTSGYDSANIFAAVPGADTRTAWLRRPATRDNFTLRIDHALSTSHLLRGSFQRNAATLDNLGVGAYDLKDRAYSNTARENLFRVSESGPLSRYWYAESRAQVRRAATFNVASVQAPTVRVLDAFTAGGAQQDGGREVTEIELATDIDYARRGHAIRVGGLVDGGSYTSNARSNYIGTFTFSSLADYDAARPSNYTRRLGDPFVAYSMWQAGLYAQDDWRVRKNLTLSGGVRQEFQTHLADHVNLGPRAGATWSPFRNGKTTVRAGGGIFYDWLDADVYEQTRRVDGVHQQDLVIVNPGYPDPLSGSAAQEVLPPSRYQLASGLVMPEQSVGVLAVTEQLTPALNVNASYSHRRGRDRLRGRNVNAPIDGARPDPLLGNITQVESTAKSEADALNVGLNWSAPARRLFLFANYAWTSQRNDADGAFSLPADSHDLAAEWARATGVPRRVASAMVTSNLTRRLRLGLSATGRSGLPYTVTTGHDDNGDTVFNDRPAGVGRNTATTAGIWDLAGRLTYAFGLGARKAAAGGGGQVLVIRQVGGGAGDLLNGLGGGGADDKRVRFELFVSASNLFNRTNLSAYSGVMTSPFFLQPTAAGPARKIDVGLRIGF